MVSRIAAMHAQRLNATPEVAQVPSVPEAPDPSGIGTDFSTTLAQGLQSVEGAQSSAHSALELLASGQQVDLHGTMIELEKADIALRTMVSVRDKVIAAYEQVMNMTV
jgi:flagellar hook-basal body complex protein FliE